VQHGGLRQSDKASRAPKACSAGTKAERLEHDPEKWKPVFRKIML
jgi:hypothetical protein